MVFRVNTVAFIVEYFDIYYALLSWLIDENPINEQISNLPNRIAGESGPG